MEKNLIVLFNVFDQLDPYPQSVESIRHAANRWGVDYFEIKSFKNTLDDLYQINKLSSTVFWTYTNFLNYDKVWVVTPDMIINSNAPNIFDELEDKYDFAAVLDGNPTNRFDYPNFLKDSIVKNIAYENDCIEAFNKYIPNFDSSHYWKNYFNLGMYLFRPKRIYDSISKLKTLLSQNTELISNFKDFFFYQNLFNAWISSQPINLKILDDTWNWVLPDMAEEWDMFLGPMQPHLYHFCGTNLAKERCVTYDRWK